MSRPEAPPSRHEPPRAVVLARRPLADLVALVMRHIAVETVVASSTRAAREFYRSRPALAIVDTSVARSEAMLSLGDGHATVAMIDLGRGGSSFRAFSEGADQVVRVPFTPDELAVRSAALLKSRGIPIRLARAVTAADLGLNLDERVRIRSRTIELGPTLNSLLYLLVARAPAGVDRDEIRTYVWGTDPEMSDTAVDALVADLARTLSDHNGGRWLVDSPGNGARIAPRGTR